MDSGDISGNTPESEKPTSQDPQEEATVRSPDEEASSVEGSCGDSDSVAPVEAPSANEEPPQVASAEKQEEGAVAHTSQDEPLPTGELLAQSVTTAPPKPYPWIIHPVVDYLFVAGGLAFIFIAANYFLVGWKVPVDRLVMTEAPFVIIMYFCQHLFSNTHNVVTYIRLFSSDEAKRKYRFYRTWLAYVFIALLILCSFVLPGEFSTGISFLFTITIFSHYCMQGFGISKIYCYKRGYMLTERENDVFRWMMISIGAYFASRFFLRKQWLRLSCTARLSPSGY